LGPAFAECLPAEIQADEWIAVARADFNGGPDEHWT